MECEASGTMRAGGWPLWLRRHAWLGSLLLLGALVRLLTAYGVTGADDLFLAGNALSVLDHGLLVPNDHYGTRAGLIYPVAGLFALFGVGEWQLGLLPLFTSLLGIWLAHALGTRLGGARVGLLAALLLAVMPLDVLYGTTLFPDLPMGVWMALAVHLLLGSREAARPWLWLVGAGLAWGMAYLIKIEAVVLGLVLLAGWALGQWDWRRFLAICLVFTGVFAAECLYYYQLTGWPVYRLQQLQLGEARMRAGPEAAATTPEAVAPVGERVKLRADKAYSAHQAWVFPKAWFITFYEVGLYYWLLLAALGWAAWTRRRGVGWLLAWLGIELFWLQFGGNPFNYYGRAHLIRYCAVINIPLVVFLALFLEQGVRSRRWRRGVVALLVASALFFANFNTLSQERPEASKQAFAKALELEAFPLYLDASSYVIARFMLRARGLERPLVNLQRMDWDKGVTELVGVRGRQGYLLLNRGFMEQKARRYGLARVQAGDAGRELFRVDNPMGGVAYAQARLLVAVANLIPVAFLRDKISHTGAELLTPGDAVLVQLDG